MAIDCLGGVFSTLSLVFKEEFDVIAGVTYSLVIVGGLLCRMRGVDAYLSS